MNLFRLMGAPESGPVAFLLIGLFLMLVGVLLRPRGEPFAFSVVFGFAESSNIIGKTVYVLGTILFVVGLYAKLR